MNKQSLANNSRRHLQHMFVPQSSPTHSCTTSRCQADVKLFQIITTINGKLKWLAYPLVVGAITTTTTTRPRLKLHRDGQLIYNFTPLWEKNTLTKQTRRHRRMAQGRCEKFLATPKKKRGKVKPGGWTKMNLFKFARCVQCQCMSVQCSAVLPFNKYHHPSSTPTRAELVEKQPRSHVYLEEAIDHFSTNYDHRANSTTDNNNNMLYDYEAKGSNPRQADLHAIPQRRNRSSVDRRIIARLKWQLVTVGRPNYLDEEKKENANEMPANGAKPTDNSNNNGCFTKACKMASSPGRPEKLGMLKPNGAAPGPPTNRPLPPQLSAENWSCSLLAEMCEDLIKACVKNPPLLIPRKSLTD
ncbi:hypothetical protein T03_6784 [Trichinella britovi]|uniref:Uncharacterized protein n=2 Tax=Trichinella TaxID=6333 RepID=A0A0V1CN52_TRIBR|nr:hypothetical protein T03_6784 [Trichinella britovi]